MIHRIGDRRTFQAFRRGERARRGPVTVTRVPDGSTPPRVAYAIGRQVGGAVQRNRLRRRLRAIVRELEPEPGAYLVGVTAEAAGLGTEELRSIVSDLMRTVR